MRACVLACIHVCLHVYVRNCVMNVWVWTVSPVYVKSPFKQLGRSSCNLNRYLVLTGEALHVSKPGEVQVGLRVLTLHL